MSLYNQTESYIDFEGNLPKQPEEKSELFEIIRAFKTKKNSVFDNSWNGTKSIESTLEELGEVYRGWRRYVPHRKNETRNKIVEELSQLIDEEAGEKIIDGLKTSGIFFVDNPVSLGVYGFFGIPTLMFPVYEILNKSNLHVVANSYSLSEFSLQMAVCGTIIGASVGAVVGSIIGRTSPEEIESESSGVIQKARFLDKLIKECKHEEDAREMEWDVNYGGSF